MTQRTPSFDSNRNWENRFPQASGYTGGGYNRSNNDYSSAYEKGYHHGYKDASNPRHDFDNDEFYNDNDYDYDDDYDYISNDYDGDDGYSDRDSNQERYREPNYRRSEDSNRGGVYFDRSFERNRNTSDSRRDNSSERQNWYPDSRRNTTYGGHVSPTGRRTESTRDNRGWGNQNLSGERDRTDSSTRGFAGISKTERTGIARIGGGITSARARRGFGSSNR